MLPTKDDGKVEVDCYLTGYPLLRCERDPEWWDAMTDKDLRKAVGATDISFDHIYTQAAVERILERDTPPNLRLTSWTLNRMKQRSVRYTYTQARVGVTWTRVLYRSHSLCR
jgi:hypothetical protein